MFVIKTTKSLPDELLVVDKDLVPARIFYYWYSPSSTITHQISFS